MHTAYRWLAGLILWYGVVPQAVGQAHFVFTAHTGVNATIAIPDTSGPTISGLSLLPGDEVGAFSTDGLCVGSVVWTGRHVAITVWGDDVQTPLQDGMLTGDTMRFRVWLQATATEIPIGHVRYASGDGVFREDGIHIVSEMSGDVGPLVVSDLWPLGHGLLVDAYPNPFNGATTICYVVSQSGPVTIRVHNLLGVVVATLEERTLPPGAYLVAWTAEEQPSGTYLCRVSTTDRSEVIRLLLIR